MDSIRAYYDQRAPEYDDWYLGTGLFGARDRPGWQEELAALLRTLAALPPRPTLDLGCGTGFLTRHLGGQPLVGLDQSPAMLGLARERAPHGHFVRGDSLALPFRDGTFGRVFTAHVYGHILPGDREAFVSEARAVGAEVVVVDAGPRAGPPRDEWQDRTLNDGSRHRVYKRFFTAAALLAEWGGERVLHEGHWFVAVSGRGGGGGSVRRAHQDGEGD
jgi:SAM-dependent methyltransferase